MKDVGKIYGMLVYFTAISYILWSCGMFVFILVWYIFPVWACRTKKNLTILMDNIM
jgi:hypothetical protein